MLTRFLVGLSNSFKTVTTEYWLFVEKRLRQYALKMKLFIRPCENSAPRSFL